MALSNAIKQSDLFSYSTDLRKQKAPSTDRLTYTDDLDKEDPKAFNFACLDEKTRLQKIAGIFIHLITLVPALQEVNASNKGSAAISNENRIYNLINNGTAKTPAQLIALTDLSRTKVTRILRQLREEGRILGSGKTKGVQYHAASLNRKAA